MTKRPSHPTPFGDSPISGKITDTPWDAQGTDLPAAPHQNGHTPATVHLVPAPPRRVLPLNDAIGHIDPEPPELPLASSLRTLIPLIEPEPFWKRSLYLGIALAVTCGYFFTLYSYWAPAPGRPGIDENGYLVGGRNFALHGTTGFKPSDNYQFVGAMWVRTEPGEVHPGFTKPAFLNRWLTVKTKEGWYYPKYPAGTSVLNAIAIWSGGPAHGHEWAFLVSPICATLAILGLFLLTRAVAGSFYGLLAMFLLACGHTTLELANDPSSHAPSLFFAVWGMFLLVRWWQSGSWWRGIAAGFLLGCGVTIRYTEALLLFPLYPLDQILHDTDLSSLHPHWWTVIKIARLLPIGPLGIAVITMIRWSRVRSYFLAILPLVGWAIPVGALLCFNWFAMGHLTGYDATNESIGFTSAEFLKKWDFTVQQIYLYASFLVMPLGLVGLILLFRSSARLGFAMLMWFLPGVLLYTSYYWGGQMPGIAFIRFFLTMVPALIVGMAWLLRSATFGARPFLLEETPCRGSIAGPFAAGLLTAAAAAVGLMISLPDLERQHRGNMNLAYSTHFALAKMKPKNVSATQPSPPALPVVIADEGVFPQYLQCLQFMTDGDFYTTDSFDLRFSGGFGIFGMMQPGKDDHDSPVLLQQNRIDFMSNFFKTKSNDDLINAQHQMLENAFASHRPVFAILTPFQLKAFKKRFITDAYTAIELDHWSEPCSIPFIEQDQPGQAKRNGPRHNALAPQSWSGEPVIHWQPQALTLLQILPKAPQTAGLGQAHALTSRD
jgi:4-amino-4-deoxy-L-arabinose transferase-like glycosyltransferase